MGEQLACRVGIGYDSHRFGQEPPLVLGGVRFPEAVRLEAFSDGDAVAHAVIDALLGAAGLGDVGSHFPPGQKEWEDANSMELLEHAVKLLHDSSWSVGNVDVTVVCESPKILPRAREIRAALAARMAVDVGRISVKGKSNEKMGWIGRGEGVAVLAVATVVPAGSG